MDNLTVKRLEPQGLSVLTELFEYNDVSQMLDENIALINSGAIDIFVLYKDSEAIGELHVKYESDDAREAVRSRRAYLYAFRVKEKYQGMGFGRFLLDIVLNMLADNGYTEFTVGVEDDNNRARYIYKNSGFIEEIARKSETYQGDSYEYSLLLKKL